MSWQESFKTCIPHAPACWSPGWIFSFLCRGVLYLGKTRELFHPTWSRKVEMTTRCNLACTNESIMLNTFEAFSKWIWMKQCDRNNIQFKKFPDFPFFTTNCEVKFFPGQHLDPSWQSQFTLCVSEPSSHSLSTLSFGIMTASSRHSHIDKIQHIVIWAHPVPYLRSTHTPLLDIVSKLCYKI